jgi:hypothetical protein
MRFLAFVGLSLALATPTFAMAEDDEEELLLLSALGLTPPAGTASVDTGGGVLESSLLVSTLVEEATTCIRSRIGLHIQALNNGGRQSTLSRGSCTIDPAVTVAPQPTNAPTPAVTPATITSIIPVTGSTGVDLLARSRLTGIVNFWSGQVMSIGSGCQAASPRFAVQPSLALESGAESRPNIDGSAVGLANTLLGLARADVAAGSVDVPANADLWLNSLVSSQVGTTPWLMASERTNATADDSVNRIASTITMAERLIVGSCKDDVRAKAALTQGVEQLRGLFVRPKDGLSTYEQAMQFSGDAFVYPLVLRLTIATSSGSRVTRNSIWTSVGIAEAIRFSGGVIVSYRLVDPTLGTIVGTGSLRCMTDTRGFGDLHRNRFDDDGRRPRSTQEGNRRTTDRGPECVAF